MKEKNEFLRMKLPKDFNYNDYPEIPGNFLQIDRCHNNFVVLQENIREQRYNWLIYVSVDLSFDAFEIDSTWDPETFYFSRDLDVPTSTDTDDERFSYSFLITRSLNFPFFAESPYIYAANNTHHKKNKTPGGLLYHVFKNSLNMKTKLVDFKFDYFQPISREKRS